MVGNIVTVAIWDVTLCSLVGKCLCITLYGITFQKTGILISMEKVHLVD